jgi:hypothetical protein
VDKSEERRGQTDWDQKWRQGIPNRAVGDNPGRGVASSDEDSPPRWDSREEAQKNAKEKTASLLLLLLVRLSLPSACCSCFASFCVSLRLIVLNRSGGSLSRGYGA